MTTNKIAEGQPGIAKAALSALCPRCGAKSLYADWSRFAPRCSVCGLDFSSFNVSDRSAIFLTIGICVVVALLAIMLDNMIRPPFWLNIVIWVPLTVALTLYSFRVVKAASLAEEYRDQSGDQPQGDET